MTVEHMSRVSDIGGVLLQYLRCAMFFWHRYHEDVQPRQARVQALSDQTKQASPAYTMFSLDACVTYVKCNCGIMFKVLNYLYCLLMKI